MGNDKQYTMANGAPTHLDTAALSISPAHVLANWGGFFNNI